MPDHRSIHFTREAFLHPLNLGFLLIASFMALVSTGTSWMPTAIFAMCVGLELIYLGSVPHKTWFQRYIIKKRTQEQGRSGMEKEQFEELDKEHQKQFLAFRAVYEKICSNFQRLPASSRPLTNQLVSRLDQMRNEYLAHLHLLERYREFLDHSTPHSITIEIRALKKEMASIASEKLLAVKKRRLQILEKRLTRYHAASEKFEICRSQKETMEDAIQYVYEKSITMSHPGELDGHLDRLINELEETSVIVQDMEDDISPTFTVLKDWERVHPDELTKAV